MDVVWVPKEGGEPKLIVPARGVGHPHFATDNDRVYVYSRQGLQSFRFDGTDRRTHLKVTGKKITPQPDAPPATDVRISPDGKYALALVNNNLYLMTVPETGGEAPAVDVSAPVVPVKKLTEIGADSFEWADGGKTITWALGSSYFRQLLSTVTFDLPPPAAERPEEARQKPAPANKTPKYEEFAVTIEVPRHTPAASSCCVGAKVITMHGDEMIPEADLVVTDNRITSIGKRAR